MQTLHLFTSLLLLLLPTTLAQTTTLVNFAALPSCATLCGPLYDAQGTCTPPGSPVSDLKTYQACFCAYGTLQSFYQEPNGVCPNACAADGASAAAELVKIQSWFTSYCASATGTSTVTATSSSASASSTKKSSSGSSSGNTDTDVNTTGQTWLHSHWKWIVMLIVLIIVISGAWIAAFLVRRHIHRKREREIEMRPPVAWGPHQLQGMTGGLGYTDGVVDSRDFGSVADKVGGNGEKVRVDPSKTRVYGGGGGDGLGFGAKEGEAEEKGGKGKLKKWIVKERT